MFDRGNKDKAHRVSADRARRIIVDTIGSNKWDEQVVTTETRIKAFFVMSPQNQQKAISEAEENELECEQPMALPPSSKPPATSTTDTVEESQIYDASKDLRIERNDDTLTQSLHEFVDVEQEIYAEIARSEEAGEAEEDGAAEKR